MILQKHLRKKNLLLSMKYWLFNERILISWFIIIPTYLDSTFSPIYPKQPGASTCSLLIGHEKTPNTRLVTNSDPHPDPFDLKNSQPPFLMYARKAGLKNTGTTTRSCCEIINTSTALSKHWDNLLLKMEINV